MTISNLLETLRLVRLHFSVFALKKGLKMLSIQSFLPLKEPLVAHLSETCAFFSRKYVVEQNMSIQNKWIFFGHTSRFLL